MSRSQKPHRVTLQDIALRTGYTINTVSHALKNKPDIAPATREYIQSVANEMGYIRNQMASTLRSGRSHTLGVIVMGMNNPYYGIMADEIQNVAVELGYSLLILCSRDDADLELQAAEAAMSRQVDGILLFPCAGSGRTIERMKAAGVPFVLMGRPMDDLDADCICCNEEEGAYLATRHLIEAGHRKLAYLSMFDVMYSTPERTHGFLRACQEANLPQEDIHIAIGKQNEEAYDQLLDWYRQGVDGLFSFCDMEAWQGIVKLSEKGVHLPEYMAFVGFDYIQGYLFFACPLCTIDYDLIGMAKSGVELLRKRIKNTAPPQPQHIMFQPRVICRGSCGMNK